VVLVTGPVEPLNSIYTVKQTPSLRSSRFQLLIRISNDPHYRLHSKTNRSISWLKPHARTPKRTKKERKEEKKKKKKKNTLDE
jgi:hypothetical protein